MTGWKWKEIQVFTGEEVCQVILSIKAIKDNALVVGETTKVFETLKAFIF